MTLVELTGPSANSRTMRRPLVILLLWIVGFGLALCLDAPVARLMRHSGIERLVRSDPSVHEIIKFPGNFGFTLAVIVLVAFLHPARWRAAMFILVCAAVSGSNQLFKWLVGRTRPFDPLDGSRKLEPFTINLLAIGEKNLCFPSGHATLAFATAAALAMLWPRLRWLFYGLATIVGMERVAENAHWLSDIVAAAALGIGGVWLVVWIAGKWKINLLTSRS